MIHRGGVPAARALSLSSAEFRRAVEGGSLQPSELELSGPNWAEAWKAPRGARRFVELLATVVNRQIVDGPHAGERYRGLYGPTADYVAALGITPGLWTRGRRPRERGGVVDWLLHHDLVAIVDDSGRAGRAAIVRATRDGYSVAPGPRLLRLIRMARSSLGRRRAADSRGCP